jgi:hypothetical protein
MKLSLGLFKKKVAEPDKSAPPSMTSSGVQAANAAATKPAKERKKISLPSAAQKPFRATKGAKYGLMIGDDGAILVYMVGNVVKSRNYVADASALNLKEFENVLTKDPKAPIFFLIDSMDQTFVQQTLPPISAMSVGKLVKRRLDRDLPADAIKGAIMLEREKTGRRDWNFLMVSLEKTVQFNTWLEFVERMDNRLQGIYLVSAEIEYVVRHLDQAMGLGKEGTGSRWKFFVSYNKVGGFRQVILKGGRMIFTRLSQPVGEASPEVIAGNIEQEMLSTIEYMKRLSYVPQDGLDVYLVSSKDIKSVFDSAKLNVSNFYPLTPFETANYFGIQGASQPTDQFGDVMLASVISSSPKHVLRLMTPLANKVNMLHQVTIGQRLLAIVSVLGIMGYAATSSVQTLEGYSEVQDLQQKKVAQQRNLDNIKEDIKTNAPNIKKVNETVALYKQITSEVNYEAIASVLPKIRAAVVSSIEIVSINWTAGAVTPAAPGAAGTQPPANEVIELNLRFPKISATAREFTAAATKVLTDLQTALPMYNITYTKLPDALTKKPESDTITLDETNAKPVEIDEKQLVATLSLTHNPAYQPPAAPAPIPPSGQPLAGANASGGAP